MELLKAVIKKQDLDKMGIEEQVCFIQAGRLINEISMFNKLLYFALNSSNDEIDLKTKNSQALIISLLLAGKLNEGNEFLRKTYDRIVKKRYAPLLSAEAQMSYKNIRKYFNNSNNPIRKIRDKLAFHHDDDVIKEELSKIKEQETFEIYFSEHTGNCLYHISSHLLMRYMLDMVNPNDHEAAIKSLFTDMRQLVDDYIEFINDYVRVVSQMYWKDFLPLEIIKINDPPNIDSISLPYFVGKS